MVQTKDYRFNRSTLPLPYDILHILLTDLVASESLGSLAKLSTLSRQYHSLITPLLYTDVHIRSDEQLQSFLSLPYERESKTKAKALNALGVKRGRSGSIKSPNRKNQSLALVRSLTLDIYPSRTSFKLASKLPAPLPASSLTFTPSALLSLHAKLSRSNAPKILATFWATHLPTLIKPKKVTVDYSTLDVREMREENWIITMGGMSVALQAWESLAQVELRGGWWAGVLPGLAVQVEMVHTDLTLIEAVPRVTIENEITPEPSDDEDEGAERPILPLTRQMTQSVASLRRRPSSTTSTAVPASVERARDVADTATTAATLTWTPAPAPPPVSYIPANQAPAEPSEELLQALGDRSKLIADRTEAIVLALRSSQALHDTAHGNVPIRWVITDFIPESVDSTLALPSSASTDSAEVAAEVKREYEREKTEIMRKILAEMDATAPVLSKKYGYIDGAGRRGLSCLLWA
ncbi:hypothetical protein IAU60_005281 [Kwoniella sp. DSM 27419]